MLPSYGKARTRKRKYKRTAEAWAARAARRRAKLVAKYGTLPSGSTDQDTGVHTSMETAVKEDCSRDGPHPEQLDAAHASKAAADTAAVTLRDGNWMRGLQADFIERVVLASRGLANHVDLDSDIAVFVRDEILRAQWLGQHDLAAAYGLTVIDTIAWVHSLE